jgi:hypothetical protein
MSEVTNMLVHCMFQPQGYNQALEHRKHVFRRRSSDIYYWFWLLGWLAGWCVYERARCLSLQVSV